MLTDMERIQHMLEVADRLIHIATSVTEEQYAASFEKQFALKFGFVMLGEDAAQISDEIRQRFPDVPWRIMKGMRNIVVHDYCKTDETVIWTTVVGDMHKLRVKLADALDTLRSEKE